MANTEQPNREPVVTQRAPGYEDAPNRSSVPRGFSSQATMGRLVVRESGQIEPPAGAKPVDAHNVDEFIPTEVPTKQQVEFHSQDT